jgi:anti-sigma B factor antagonist
MRLAEQEIDDRTRVIAVVGELDGGGGDRLISRIDRITPEAGNHLVLDLTDMSFMDSLGLSGVLGAWMVLAARPGRTTLVAPVGGRAYEIFKLTGVLERLTVAGSRKQALVP